MAANMVIRAYALASTKGQIVSFTSLMIMLTILKSATDKRFLQLWTLQLHSLVMLAVAIPKTTREKFFAQEAIVFSHLPLSKIFVVEDILWLVSYASPTMSEDQPSST